MNNYLENFRRNYDRPETPSDAIDQMISMSISENERPSLNERILDVVLSVKDKHQLALQNRFPQIDSLKRLAWNQTSPEYLQRAEMKILERLKTPFHGRFVPVLNNTEKIWTIYTNVTSTNIPLVLLHGFAGGVGLWSLSLDQISADRPVFAIDLPGFGRSSRPMFSVDPYEAEKQFVNMLEEWRIGIGLDKRFIILGHSFGGFLSASYALHYPKYIKQLVLIDPWGFEHKPDDIWQSERLKHVPIWLRSLSSVVMKVLPLSGIRAAGPFGLPIIKYLRPDLRAKFEDLFDDDRILTYLYHCNSQLPTGEQAFKTISDCFVWAKNPMVDRIFALDERIPIYFLHGERSWISVEPSIFIQKHRRNALIEIMPGAGHHIYADVPFEFEMYLKRILYNKY